MYKKNFSAEIREKIGSFERVYCVNIYCPMFLPIIYRLDTIHRTLVYELVDFEPCARKVDGNFQSIQGQIILFSHIIVKVGIIYGKPNFKSRKFLNNNKGSRKIKIF